MSFRDELLYNAADTLLYPRSGLSAGGSDERPSYYKVIGLVLAISSGAFIGVSFVIKKVGLLKANEKYQEEAGEGYGYLKNWWWWCGMTLMIIGEVCNFVAYAFVDAIMVTPMGALSVVVTAILSAIFLKERLSFVGKVGCFNCIIGSVVIVINAPEQSSVADIQEMKEKVVAPGFLSYAGVVILGCFFTALWAGPRWGKKSMMVYITICSMIGGLSVVATQGLGAAIIAQANGKAQFNQWFLYVVLVFVIVTLLTEIIYLNKALNLFNAALVTPTYYVFFTSSTIVTSAILFQGFKGTASTISTVVMGFLQICSGVVLLQLSKSAKDVPDTAVFAGDLDQVRTVAEQEEPEWEPRADTIRGGAAIIRSMSKMRHDREAEEARRLHDEHMQPIGEDEMVEWDGMRRRKTVSSGGPSIRRQRTTHPPLGMSRFPNDQPEHEDDDADMHPGFFERLRSRRGTKSTGASVEPMPPLPLHSIPSSLSSRPSHDGADKEASTEHVYGLPVGLQREHDVDTSYKPHETTIHWSNSVLEHSKPQNSSSTSLVPPQEPANTAKRQFSFQNPFHRHRNSDDHGEVRETDSSHGRPQSRPTTARSGLSFTNRQRSGTGRSGATDGATEEERLGLVHGDSREMPSHLSRTYTTISENSPEYEDDDWARVGSDDSELGLGPGGQRGRNNSTHRERRESDEGEKRSGAGGSGVFL